MSCTEFVVKNTSQEFCVWQFLQPHRSMVLCKDGKLLVSVHLATDAPAVAAQLDQFQLFAKDATKFGMWVCNHTDDFIAMILNEGGKGVPINYYTCVRPHHERLIESDNRHDNRRLMIKAQAENKTVAEVKAEAAATGKAADVTELVFAVTPTTQDFKGAKWSMAPLAIRGDPKPTRMALVKSAAHFGSSFDYIQDTSEPVARGIGYSYRPPSDNEVSYGSSSASQRIFGSATPSFGSSEIGSSGFGRTSQGFLSGPSTIGYSSAPGSSETESSNLRNITFGSSALNAGSGPDIIPESAPIPSEGFELQCAVVPRDTSSSPKRSVDPDNTQPDAQDKKAKMQLPGEMATAGKIGVSDEKVDVNGVEFQLNLNMDQTVSFTLLLSIWNKLEVTLPSAADIEDALKKAGSVAGAITKVYESAEDVILGDAKPDCVFFSCGHKITTMELATNLSKCPMCRSLIYARVPASEIRGDAVVQQI